MIPYGHQDITDADISAVIDVLRSQYLTQGSKCPEFEVAVSKYCGAKHAIALNSATSALHVSCMALDLKEGDYLWTSPNTFVATSNCALYCGANVDFVDIDPHSYNMCMKSLEKKLKYAEREGALPKIVVPVHFAGQPCEMEKLHELSNKFGFKVIEDASHSIGSTYQGYKTGSCKYSDITVFSFHPVKVITTAEGGMALTNNPQIAEKVRRLRSHGIDKEKKYFNEDAQQGDWFYEQTELGFNYRLTDIQAALGVSQLKRLDNFVQSRHRVKNFYDEVLHELPVIIPYQSPNSYSSLHLYPIQIDDMRCSIERKKVFDHMRREGVGVNVHYIPVHTQPFYKKMGFRAGQFPVAEGYYRNALSLPIFPKIQDHELNKVVKALKAALRS
ncbi:UDP-4-amino-4,6-dideoxy-N-acetyl-beta-L-altrosamine transaminase [Alphaproteobacteria bacterium]|nr:UDP-4-amino-4,6-dideoxy-N-acetyl-beta-L-altrosamine transaminase [Alphaproteobacteria bacterium]